MKTKEVRLRKPKHIGEVIPVVQIPGSSKKLVEVKKEMESRGIDQRAMVLCEEGLFVYTVEDYDRGICMANKDARLLLEGSTGIGMQNKTAIFVQKVCGKNGIELPGHPFNAEREKCVISFREENVSPEYSFKEYQAHIAEEMYIIAVFLRSDFLTDKNRRRLIERYAASPVKITVSRCTYTQYSDKVLTPLESRMVAPVRYNNLCSHSAEVKNIEDGSQKQVYNNIKEELDFHNCKMFLKPISECTERLLSKARKLIERRA